MLNLSKRCSEVLTRMASKEELFMWEIKFGNNADRTVISLFCVGNRIYIEDDISQKKPKPTKPRKLQPACMTTWVTLLGVQMHLYITMISSKLDQKVYQRSNSSIKGISTLISHWKWLQKVGSRKCFINIVFIPRNKITWTLKIVFIGKAFLHLHIRHKQVDGRSWTTEYFVFSL